MRDLHEEAAAVDGRAFSYGAGEDMRCRRGRSRQVLPEARKARELGSERGLIVRMEDDFDAPLEDFAEYV